MNIFFKRLKFRVAIYLFFFLNLGKKINFVDFLFFRLNFEIKQSYIHDIILQKKVLLYIYDYKFMEIQPICKSLTFHSGVKYFSNEETKFDVCRLAEIMKSVGSAWQK